MTADRERARAAAIEEIARAKSSIYTRDLRIAELEQENEKLRREIEELKQPIKHV